MNGKEGLILQGCGGEVQEWVDGINKMLTDKGILLDNTKFENVSVFKSDGVVQKRCNRKKSDFVGLFCCVARDF